METISLTSMKKEFRVKAAQQTALEVFTTKMDLWWPRTHDIGSAEMTQMVDEPCVNGRWYTKHADGTEANIRNVLTIQRLFVLAWQINGDFQCDSNLITEVMAEFIVDGPKISRVKFEHKDLDKLGGGKLGGGKAVASMDEGWSMIMEQYKKQAES